MTTDRDDTASSRRTAHPRPTRSSTNSSSTATAPSRTNLTRGRYPKPHRSPAASPTSSTPSWWPLSDTRLEPDLEDLLWSTVNLFHRATGRIERELDDNELAQQRSQREQDGSEVKSVELERLTAEGQTLIERRNAFELMRDQAAEHFERHTRSTWRPRSGSMVNHRHLTSAMIDSRDFLAARKRADNQVLLPAGPKIALTGGLDFNDHRLIWDRLDQVHAKHPDMVLLHGGSPKGAELHRRQMGRQPKGAADRLQARLDEARQGRPVQAQRRHAGRAADRRHALPRHRHPGQPRRQGEEARHPGLEVRRRVSAAPSHYECRSRF